MYLTYSTNSRLNNNTMSLFKSLKELTVATVQLAKEDKTFRKEL